MDKEDILKFWFKECTPQQWFKKDYAFDNLLEERFAGTLELAFEGKLDDWTDQFPRNIFRDTPRSFSGDEKALSLSFQCTENGYHFNGDVHYRYFMLMPRMHSEDITVQNDSLLLFKKLNLDNVYDYAVQHRDIVARFGRFPHRNLILGRSSSKEELEFLEQKGSSF